jgi:hypothetical protein
MGLEAIAIKTGVPVGQLEDLLAGKAPVMLANKLGLSPGVVQAFLDGMVHPGIASPFGVSHTGLQPLADRLGKVGRIGVLFGLMLRDGRAPSQIQTVRKELFEEAGEKEAPEDEAGENDGGPPT